MGSTRLPGKSMFSLGDVKVIDWVVRRASMATLVDRVIVAIPLGRQDDKLEEYLKVQNINVFRGSETSVYERFKGALLGSEEQIVVRICADRPLVCPRLIDEAVAHFREINPDLVFNHKSGLLAREMMPFGFGVEVFSSEYFYADNYVSGMFTDYDLEHVTPRLYNNQYRSIYLPPREVSVIVDGKYDLDDHADYIRLKTLIKNGIKINSTFYDIYEKHI